MLFGVLAATGARLSTGSDADSDLMLSVLSSSTSRAQPRAERTSRRYSRRGGPGSGRYRVRTCRSSTLFPSDSPEPIHVKGLEPSFFPFGLREKGAEGTVGYQICVTH